MPGYVSFIQQCRNMNYDKVTFLLTDLFIPQVNIYQASVLCKQG